MRVSLVTLVAMTAAAMPAVGCMCFERPVCDTFSEASAVFIGKVESQDPIIDLWDPIVKKGINDLIDNPSPGALSNFKKRYADEFPEPIRTEIKAASNVKELVRAVSGLDPRRKKRITLVVQQAYKGLGSEIKRIEVWTAMTDCGIAFHGGETYVVYATVKENELVTSACSRTRRLSEAGDDLVYLHFLQNGGSDTGRIWGFVSNDRKEVAAHLGAGDEAVASVPNVPVLLRTIRGSLQGRTNRDGRFVFDGLPAGDYDVTVEEQQRKVHLESKACRSEWFYVPKSTR
jgi:hypothetical protein